MARSGTSSLAGAAETAATLVAVPCVVFVAQKISPVPLEAFGIVPRTLWGLVGVACGPLLHANLGHLLANIAPLFVLLCLLFWDRKYKPVLTLVQIWLWSGLGTWLIGRGAAVHLGASSVIYGLVAYLIVAGVLLRRWRSALVSVLVLVLYGGIFYGVLPRQGPISWEGHLCGALAGMWATYRIR